PATGPTTSPEGRLIVIPMASIAEKAGHKVLLVDARTLALSPKDVAVILADFKPDAMGFMMTTYMFQDTLEWIRYLKIQCPVPIIVGGYNLRVYPRETLVHPEIDFGVVEHAYFTIPALLTELSCTDPNFDRVPGLVYKKGGDIVVTPHPQLIDFNLFPNPARHLLPNELYAEFTAERRNFTVMVTSLGCPYKCSFCEAGGTIYNSRSPQTVIHEIEECYDKYQIRDIDIFDYNFTAERERVLEICRLICEKGLNISWACRSRVDTVDKELLEIMKKAGCSRIYFGIESGSQDTLKVMRKGISIREIQTILHICRSLGIRTLGFFLIGAPGDTREKVFETIRFAKSLPLDYAQFSKTLAKPLTPLWSDLLNITGKDYWK
ncbi:MAG: radical SAM protein, partial [Candidatus Omnitrophota bacterium]